MSKIFNRYLDMNTVPVDVDEKLNDKRTINNIKSICRLANEASSYIRRATSINTDDIISEIETLEKQKRKYKDLLEEAKSKGDQEAIAMYENLINEINTKIAKLQDKIQKRKDLLQHADDIKKEIKKYTFDDSSSSTPNPIKFVSFTEKEESPNGIMNFTIDVTTKNADEIFDTIVHTSVNMYKRLLQISEEMVKLDQEIKDLNNDRKIRNNYLLVLKEISYLLDSYVATLGLLRMVNQESVAWYVDLPSLDNIIISLENIITRFRNASKTKTRMFSLLSTYKRTFEKYRDTMNEIQSHLDEDTFNSLYANVRRINELNIENLNLEKEAELYNADLNTIDTLESDKIIINSLIEDYQEDIEELYRELDHATSEAERERILNEISQLNAYIEDLIISREEKDAQIESCYNQYKYERCTDTDLGKLLVVDDEIIPKEYDPTTMIKKKLVIRAIPDIEIGEYVRFNEDIEIDHNSIKERADLFNEKIDRNTAEIISIENIIYQDEYSAKAREEEANKIKLEDRLRIISEGMISLSSFLNKIAELSSDEVNLNERKNSLLDEYKYLSSFDYLTTDNNDTSLMYYIENLYDDSKEINYLTNSMNTISEFIKSMMHKDFININNILSSYNEFRDIVRKMTRDIDHPSTDGYSSRLLEEIESGIDLLTIFKRNKDVIDAAITPEESIVLTELITPIMDANIQIWDYRLLYNPILDLYNKIEPLKEEIDDLTEKNKKIDKQIEMYMDLIAHTTDFEKIKEYKLKIKYLNEDKEENTRKQTADNEEINRLLRTTLVNDKYYSSYEEVVTDKNMYEELIAEQEDIIKYYENIIYTKENEKEARLLVLNDKIIENEEYQDLCLSNKNLINLKNGDIDLYTSYIENLTLRFEKLINLENPVPVIFDLSENVNLMYDLEDLYLATKKKEIYISLKYFSFLNKNNASSIQQMISTQSELKDLLNGRNIYDFDSEIEGIITSLTIHQNRIDELELTDGEKSFINNSLNELYNDKYVKLLNVRKKFNEVGDKCSLLEDYDERLTNLSVQMDDCEFHIQSLEEQIERETDPNIIESLNNELQRYQTQLSTYNSQDESIRNRINEILLSETFINSNIHPANKEEMYDILDSYTSLFNNATENIENYIEYTENEKIREVLRKYYTIWDIITIESDTDYTHDVTPLLDSSIENYNNEILRNVSYMKNTYTSNNLYLSIKDNIIKDDIDNIKSSDVLNGYILVSNFFSSEFNEVIRTKENEVNELLSEINVSSYEEIDGAIANAIIENEAYIKERDDLLALTTSDNIVDYYNLYKNMVSFIYEENEVIPPTYEPIVEVIEKDELTIKNISSHIDGLTNYVMQNITGYRNDLNSLLLKIQNKLVAYGIDFEILEIDHIYNGNNGYDGYYDISRDYLVYISNLKRSGKVNDDMYIFNLDDAYNINPVLIYYGRVINLFYIEIKKFYLALKDFYDNYDFTNEDEIRKINENYQNMLKRYTRADSSETGSLLVVSDDIDPSQYDPFSMIKRELVALSIPDIVVGEYVRISMDKSLTEGSMWNYIHTYSPSKNEDINDFPALKDYIYTILYNFYPYILNVIGEEKKEIAYQIDLLLAALAVTMEEYIQGGLVEKYEELLRQWEICIGLIEDYNSKIQGWTECGEYYNTYKLSFDLVKQMFAYIVDSAEWDVLKVDDTTRIKSRELTANQMEEDLNFGYVTDFGPVFDEDGYIVLDVDRLRDQLSGIDGLIGRTETYIEEIEKLKDQKNIEINALINEEKLANIGLTANFKFNLKLTSFIPDANTDDIPKLYIKNNGYEFYKLYDVITSPRIYKNDYNNREYNYLINHGNSGTSLESKSLNYYYNTQIYYNNTQPGRKSWYNLDQNILDLTDPSYGYYNTHIAVKECEIMYKYSYDIEDLDTVIENKRQDILENKLARMSNIDFPGNHNTKKLNKYGVNSGIYTDVDNTLNNLYSLGLYNGNNIDTSILRSKPPLAYEVSYEIKNIPIILLLSTPSTPEQVVQAFTKARTRESDGQLVKLENVASEITSLFTKSVDKIIAHLQKMKPDVVITDILKNNITRCKAIVKSARMAMMYSRVLNPSSSETAKNGFGPTDVTYFDLVSDSGLVFRVCLKGETVYDGFLFELNFDQSQLYSYEDVPLTSIIDMNEPHYATDVMLEYFDFTNVCLPNSYYQFDDNIGLREYRFKSVSGLDTKLEWYRLVPQGESKPRDAKMIIEDGSKYLVKFADVLNELGNKNRTYTEASSMMEYICIQNDKKYTSVNNLPETEKLGFKYFMKKLMIYFCENSKQLPKLGVEGKTWVLDPYGANEWYRFENGSLTLFTTNESNETKLIKYYDLYKHMKFYNDYKFKYVYKSDAAELLSKAAVVGNQVYVILNRTIVANDDPKLLSDDTVMSISMATKIGIVDPKIGDVITERKYYLVVDDNIDSGVFDPITMLKQTTAKKWLKLSAIPGEFIIYDFPRFKMVERTTMENDGNFTFYYETSNSFNLDYIDYRIWNKTEVYSDNGSSNTEYYKTNLFCPNLPGIIYVKLHNRSLLNEEKDYEILYKDKLYPIFVEQINKMKLDSPSLIVYYCAPKSENMKFASLDIIFNDFTVVKICIWKPNVNENTWEYFNTFIGTIDSTKMNVTRMIYYGDEFFHTFKDMTYDKVSQKSISKTPITYDEDGNPAAYRFALFAMMNDPRRPDEDFEDIPLYAYASEKDITTEFNLYRNEAKEILDCNIIKIDGFKDGMRVATYKNENVIGDSSKVYYNITDSKYYVYDKDTSLFTYTTNTYHREILNHIAEYYSSSDIDIDYIIYSKNTEKIVNCIDTYSETKPGFSEENINRIFTNSNSEFLTSLIYRESPYDYDYSKSRLDGVVLSDFHSRYWIRTSEKNNPVTLFASFCRFKGVNVYLDIDDMFNYSIGDEIIDIDKYKTDEASYQYINDELYNYYETMSYDELYTQIYMYLSRFIELLYQTSELVLISRVSSDSKTAYDASDNPIIPDPEKVYHTSDKYYRYIDGTYIDEKNKMKEFSFDGKADFVIYRQRGDTVSIDICYLSQYSSHTDHLYDIPRRCVEYTYDKSQTDPSIQGPFEIDKNKMVMSYKYLDEERETIDPISGATITTMHRYKFFPTYMISKKWNEKDFDIYFYNDDAYSDEIYEESCRAIKNVLDAVYSTSLAQCDLGADHAQEMNSADYIVAKIITNSSIQFFFVNEEYGRSDPICAYHWQKIHRTNQRYASYANFPNIDEMSDAEKQLWYTANDTLITYRVDINDNAYKMVTEDDSWVFYIFDSKYSIVP